MENTQEWKDKFPEWDKGHQYGHEFRGFSYLKKEYLPTTRFDSRTQQLALIVALHHMNLHYLHKMKTRKAVLFFRNISKNFRSDFINCCHCDHDIEDEIFNLWNLIDDVMKTIKIEIPDNTKDPSEYVTNLITKEVKIRMSDGKR